MRDVRPTTADMKAPKPFTPLEFPTWIVWRVRRGASLPQPPGVGPNGRKLCCWCAQEVPRGRRNWCSREHQDAFYRVWTWQALALYVHQRAGERCERCGSDHPGWRQSQRWPNATQCYLVKMPWQCDHIIPVKDGGTDDPANLRNLCHPCHVAVGYEQRAARKARVPQPPAPPDLQTSLAVWS